MRQISILLLLAGCDPALVQYAAAPEGQLRTPSDASTIFTAREHGRASEVAVVGDLDADGFDDLVVTDQITGVSSAETPETVAFVVYGRAGGFGAQEALTDAGVALGATGTRLSRARPAGDVDADGFDDFLIGDPHDAESLFPGEANGVYLVRGGQSRLQDGSLASSATLFSAAGAGRAGYDAATGDLDGDGILDLAVTAPELGDGATYVMYGPLPLGTGTVDLTTADLVLEGAAWRVAFGDHDGDGVDDLVTSDFDSDAAEVRVFRGGHRPTGILTAADADAIVTGASPFGWRVELADVDGDGTADLIVGDPRHGGRGAVHTFLGGASLPALRTDADADASVVGVDPHGQLAYALATGDTDGDGSHELFLGANGAAGAYLVSAFDGTLSASAEVVGGPASDGLGESVTLGDIDGDGVLDQIVAVPTLANGDEDGGSVLVFLGHGA